MNISKTVKYCLGLSEYSLRCYARENYNKVYNFALTKLNREKTNSLMLGSIFTCVALNGKLTEGERKFISEFIGGYTYEQMMEIAGQFYNDEAREISKNLVASFPEDIKEAYINLCAAVLAYDKRVDDCEKIFLNELL